MDRRQRLIARARQGYRVAYGAEPSRFFAAPGRVNLIGEHVDYNKGFVLPCAIDRDTVVALGPAEKDAKGQFIDAVAIDLGNAKLRVPLDGAIKPSANSWENHVRGVVDTILRQGNPLKPARIAISGDIPIGAGLSSSASLGVAIALALSEYSGLSLSPTTLARIAQRAENDFVGCACGIMDQMASTSAKAGHALLLDCETLQSMPIPISPGLAIMVIDSGVRRQLTESAFNVRRDECVAAAQHYCVASLRQLDADRLETARGALDDVMYRRARHVVHEIALVEPAAIALAKGNTALLAQVMAASHDSLRHDFEVTVPEIDRLVDLVAGVLGDAGGVRMTGGGFGGCVVAVMARDAASAVEQAVERSYNATAAFPARVDLFEPSDGAAPITLA